MRIKPQQVRILAAIALQRASERELRTLYETIASLSPLAFVELIRNIEDEIDSSLSMGFEHSLEHDQHELEMSGLYKELEKIRRQDLRLPVYRFAELLTESLVSDPSIKNSGIPNFDARRGLQAWVRRLVLTFSEQQVYRAVVDLRRRMSGESGSAWKLR